MEYRPDAPECEAAGRRPAPQRNEPLTPGTLANRLAAHLRTTDLISPDCTVLVAVSGGLDSVVLLHLLRFSLRDWRFRVVAAHFDHRMREDSGRDAAWVAGLCRAWGVMLERGAAPRRLRGEAEAREARYAFLREAARRHGADRVATAHHADDQAETVLFRIMRGTGLRGLVGIPARRGRLVRPLLPFGRAELVGYAQAARLRHREDPTNRELFYTRNRIRHEVLPLLEAVTPGATASLLHLAEHSRRDLAAWDAVLETLEARAVVAETRDRIELARPVLLGYHPEVLARLFRRILGRFGILPGQGGTRAAVEFTISGRSGARVEMGGGVLLERSFDRILIRCFRRGAESVPDRPLLIAAAGSGEGEAVVGGRRYVVQWNVEHEPSAGATVTLPVAGVRFPLELRSWRPGDRIRLSYGTKKLKKLFAERRVARDERGRIPVLAEVGGRVLWVAGLGAAALEAPEFPRLRIMVTDVEHV